MAKITIANEVQHRIDPRVYGHSYLTLHAYYPTTVGLGFLTRGSANFARNPRAYEAILAAPLQLEALIRQVWAGIERTLGKSRFCLLGPSQNRRKTPEPKPAWCARNPSRLNQAPTPSPNEGSITCVS